MKKTLIALFALSSVSMATIEKGTAFTLDSNDGVNSVFEAMIGLNKDEAVTATGLQIDRAGYPSATADIHINQLLSSINLNDLAEGHFLLVDTVEFSFRFDKQSQYIPTSASITTTIGGETYTGTLTDTSYETGKYGTYVFTMDTPFALTGTEENVQFALTKEGNQFGFGVAKNSETATIYGANDFGSGWCPVVRLSGVVAPEPATATLSLLALAGLAARRRRH